MIGFISNKWDLFPKTACRGTALCSFGGLRKEGLREGLKWKIFLLIEERVV